MLRALQAIYSLWAMISFTLLILITFPIVLLILLLPEKKRVVWMHHYLQGFANAWFLSCAIKPSVYNKHLLNEQDGCVIVANHASYIDAAVLYTAISKVFKTLGKAEVAKAPLFGLIYRTVVVTVDRSSNMAKARSMINMANDIKNGLDVVIFPEGTFDDVPVELLPFHAGAFKLAIDSGRPVLPLILLDATKRMHPKSLWRWSPGKNRSVFLPAINTNTLGKHQDDELKDYMYSYMSHMWKYCVASGPRNSEQEALKWLAANAFTKN
ncbi:MAG: hypothetical protein RL660_2585 [Bacteroidota bacterium]|jgi:1-acyl-sn-glycerol-3-phosphate acyltransferase